MNYLSNYLISNPTTLVILRKSAAFLLLLIFILFALGWRQTNVPGSSPRFNPSLILSSSVYGWFSLFFKHVLFSLRLLQDFCHEHCVMFLFIELPGHNPFVWTWFKCWNSFTGNTQQLSSHCVYVVKLILESFCFGMFSISFSGSLKCASSPSTADFATGLDLYRFFF